MGFFPFLSTFFDPRQQQGAAEQRPQLRRRSQFDPQQMETARQRYNDALDAAPAAMETPRQGRLSRVGEVMTSIGFGPEIGRMIFHGREDREARQHEMQGRDWARNTGVMRQGYEDALREQKDADEDEERRQRIAREEAQTNWYKARTDDRQGQPPAQSPHTITTDKGIMQWNPQTNRYDIPVGGAPTRPTAGPHGTVSTGKGVLQFNPQTERYDIYVGPPNREPRGESGPRASPAQRVAAERWKANELQKLERDFREGQTEGQPMSDEEMRNRKQAIQDAYEQQLDALGARVTHFDYPAAGRRAARPAPPPAAARKDPLGIF